MTNVIKGIELSDGNFILEIPADADEIKIREHEVSAKALAELKKKFPYVRIDTDRIDGRGILTLCKKPQYDWQREWTIIYETSQKKKKSFWKFW